MLVFFVCVGYSSHLRIHSYGEVTITGEGVQILSYAQHSWPLSSEGSLACHTYYDTGQPFMMVISEDPWHSHLLPSFWQWSCHYLFLRLRSTVAGIRTPNFRLRGERSNRLSHRLGNLPFPVPICLKFQDRKATELEMDQKNCIRSTY